MKKLACSLIIVALCKATPMRFPVKVLSKGKLEHTVSMEKGSCAPMHAIVGEIRKRNKPKKHSKVTLSVNGKIIPRTDYSKNKIKFIDHLIIKSNNGKRSVKKVSPKVTIIISQ